MPDDEARWAEEARETVDAVRRLLAQGLDGGVPLAQAVEGAQALLAQALDAERERAAAARERALARLEPPEPDDARQRRPDPRAVLAALRRVRRRS